MAAAALTLGSLFATVGAQAAPVLPFGSLSFIAPTGSGLNTEAFDVWVRFERDSGSPALNFSSNPLTGIDPALIPTQGKFYGPGAPELRDFASVYAANLNV